MLPKVPKDTKTLKPNNSQGSNINQKNKRLENKVCINEILIKTKSSKMPTDNSIHNQKNKEVRNNKITKKFSSEAKMNTKEKQLQKKKNSSKYQTKSINDKTHSKVDSSTKSKVSNNLISTEKKTNKNKVIPKKNSKVSEHKKSPFMRSKTNYINSKRMVNINNGKNINEETGTRPGTKKLLELLKSLSPIDKSKCNQLIDHNINQILELENKIKEIIIQTQEEIEVINNNGNKNTNDDNEEDKIGLEQNLEIINKESKMRKDIYIILFSFIKELLEQINYLSYDIANQELSELNNLPNNDNLFFINNNNNTSITSNNSLFVPEIQEEFCGRLLNITKSFINSEFDISEIKFMNGGEMKFGKNYEDNLFNDDEDYKEYNNLLKNKSKKNMLMHPNEILNKIKNEELKNKDKKIIHHYSNSLKVNSNLEKLEEKINNDEDNINSDQFGNLKNMMQKNNCFIF